MLSRILTPFFLCLVTLTSHAQLKVYNTYEDLVNEQPSEEIEERFVYKEEDENILTLIDKKTKEKRQVDYTKIWGFTYKDSLFRIWRHGQYCDFGPENYPIMLAHEKNGAFYWLHGDIVYTLSQDSKQWELHPSSTGFVTASLDGDGFMVTGGMKGPEK